MVPSYRWKKQYRNVQVGDVVLMTSPRWRPPTVFFHKWTPWWTPKMRSRVHREVDQFFFCHVIHLLYLFFVYICFNCVFLKEEAELPTQPPYSFDFFLKIRHKWCRYHMTKQNIYQLLIVFDLDLICDVHHGDQQVLEVPKTILICFPF